MINYGFMFYYIIYNVIMIINIIAVEILLE